MRTSERVNALIRARARLQEYDVRLSLVPMQDGMCAALVGSELKVKLIAPAASMAERLDEWTLEHLPLMAEARA